MIQSQDIVEFAPGHHTSKPYYALVIYADLEMIVTWIPGGHELEIDNANRDYHFKRITVVGKYPECNHLIYNQKLPFVK